jgi:Putative  PD-(D/E)XK family member, (DUF4420)
MSQMPDLGPIIASLRAEEGAGLVRRLVDPSAPVRVYLGVDPAGAQPGVLVAVNRRLVPEQKNLPSGAGFAVRPTAVRDDPKDVVNLGVFCTDSACEDIFLHFMNDVVSHLLREAAADAAVKTFLARVSLWQRFFVAGGDSLLSAEAQCGLFAELLMLRDILIPSAGASAAVDGWKGPEGGPQDFVLNPCAVEVKCSRAKAGAKIPISNEQQLDERPFPHLVLAHVAAAAGGGSNQSLTDLVADVRSLLAGSGRPLDAFNDRLITAGCVDAHEARYSENRLFVREVRYFEVRDDFPRVRPGDFPPGVVDVTYKLDPAALVPFEVDQAAVEGWLKS